MRFPLATALFCLCSMAQAAVDVNTATVVDLDGVKGIGPAKSARILKEREKGAFRDWPDFIERVRGVGTSTARRLSDEGVTVDGQPYMHAAQDAAGPHPHRQPRR